MRLDSKKIKVLMIEKDINLTELSKASGLSYTLLSVIRSGKSCRPESADAIAKALDVNLNDILLKDRGAVNDI